MKKPRYPRTFFVDLSRSPEGLTDLEVVELLLTSETKKANYKGGVSWGKFLSPDPDYRRVHGLLVAALLSYAFRLRCSPPGRGVSDSLPMPCGQALSSSPS